MATCILTGRTTPAANGSEAQGQEKGDPMPSSEVKLENEAAQSTNALGPLIGVAREDFVPAALRAHAYLDAALEIGAYEALWCEHNASFKSIAERFRGAPGSRPSHLVPEPQARETGSKVLAKLRERTRQRFDIRIHGEWEYPERLRDAADPVELLYIQGEWDLVTLPAVAVVGTRKPSEIGVERTQTLARRLVKDGFTVVSGLAEGVDTAAHNAAAWLVRIQTQAMRG